MQNNVLRSRQTPVIDIDIRLIFVSSPVASPQSSATLLLTDSPPVSVMSGIFSVNQHCFFYMIYQRIIFSAKNFQTNQLARAVSGICCGAWSLLSHADVFYSFSLNLRRNEPLPVTALHGECGHDKVYGAHNPRTGEKCIVVDWLNFYLDFERIVSCYIIKIIETMVCVDENY